MRSLPLALALPGHFIRCALTLGFASLLELDFSALTLGFASLLERGHSL